MCLRKTTWLLKHDILQMCCCCKSQICWQSSTCKRGFKQTALRTEDPLSNHRKSLHLQCLSRCCPAQSQHDAALCSGYKCTRLYCVTCPVASTDVWQSFSDTVYRSLGSLHDLLHSQYSNPTMFERRVCSSPWTCYKALQGLTPKEGFAFLLPSTTRSLLGGVKRLPTKV